MTRCQQHDRANDKINSLTANHAILGIGLDSLALLVQIRIQIKQLVNGQIIFLHKFRAREIIDVFAGLCMISAVDLADTGDISPRVGVEARWLTFICVNSCNQALENDYSADGPHIELFSLACAEC
jgi:hypothetical protein